MQGRFNVVPERRPEKKDDGGNGPHTESPLENSSETVLAPRLMPIDNLQSNTTEKRGKVSKEHQKMDSLEGTSQCSARLQSGLNFTSCYLRQPIYMLQV